MRKGPLCLMLVTLSIVAPAHTKLAGCVSYRLSSKSTIESTETPNLSANACIKRGSCPSFQVDDDECALTCSCASFSKVSFAVSFSFDTILVFLFSIAMIGAV